MDAKLLALSIPLAVLSSLPAYAAETYNSCPLSEDGIPECAKPTIEVGARTGVALPAGSAASGAKMNDTIDAQIPVQLDLGFRPDPHLFVGGYGAYGFVLPASGVCANGSCSGSDVRVGLEAQYHFRPAHRFDPWVGVGAGYEWLHLSSWSNGSGETGGTSEDLTLRGWELVNVQAGLDYSVCSGLRVGPYAGFSLGQYATASESITLGGVEHAATTDISETGLHDWITLGVRGSFDL